MGNSCKGLWMPVTKAISEAQKIEHKKLGFTKHRTFISFYNLGHTSLILAKQFIWEHYLVSDSVQRKNTLGITMATINCGVVFQIYFMIFIIQFLVAVLLQKALVLRDLVTQLYSFQKQKQTQINGYISGPLTSSIRHKHLFFLLRHKPSNLAISLGPWRSRLKCVLLTLSKALETFLKLCTDRPAENPKLIFGVCSMPEITKIFHFLANEFQNNWKTSFPRK